MTLISATLCSAQEPAAARNIAFCIAQLSLSDKALRKLGDMWKTYHLALCDEAILGYFKVRYPKP
jgi:condensin complex subunit 1